MSSALLAAAIIAALIIRDVCRFGRTGTPGSHVRFSSGCDAAFLPRFGGMQTDVAGESHFFGLALRKIDWSVTAFAGAGLVVTTDAALAAGADGCFEAIKLQM